MPNMKNWRNEAGASHRPSGPVIVAKSPITKQPETFTTSVPQGNVWPTLLAMKPETHHRAKVPSPPPTKIHSAFSISHQKLSRRHSIAAGPGRQGIPPPDERLSRQ